MSVPAHSQETPNHRHNGPCPWYMAYLFDNPLRRWLHPPQQILEPYIKSGMRTLDIGCGFGHYAIGMAELMGPSGHVIAIDMQEEMLKRARSRALKRGLQGRITFKQCESKNLKTIGNVDFAIASYVVHEIPNPQQLMHDVFNLLPNGGLFYVMEPKGHMSASQFEQEIHLAKMAGFTVLSRPNVSHQLSVVLQKPSNAGNKDITWVG